MSRKHESIRRNLLLYIGMSTTLVMVLTATVLSLVIGQQLTTKFDKTLEDRVRTLASLCELDDEILEFSYSGDEMGEFSTGEKNQFFQLWSESGIEIARSPSLGDNHLEYGESTLDLAVFRDVVLPDGRQGRLVELSFRPRLDVEVLKPGEDPDTEIFAAAEEKELAPVVFIVLVSERESLQQELVWYRVSIFSALLLGLVLVLLLVRILVDHGLSPLQQLAERVSGITVNSLREPIQTDAAAVEELVPIENGLNLALTGLDAAFQRERDFSANVAHELRTPLAELRSLCDVAQMIPEDRGQQEGFFQDTKQITKRMEHSVLRLLELARLDAGHMKARHEKLELTDLLESLQNKISTNPEWRDRVKFFENCTAVLYSDIDLLEKTLNNLLENALTHSPPNSRVSIECLKSGGKLSLRLSNEAPELTDLDLDKLCKRFWRKDGSRTGDRHAGLGLALVGQWAELLQLGLSFELHDGKLSVTLDGIQLVNSSQDS